MVADFVRSATQGIPVEQLASMAPGTGSLATAASAAVNLVVGGMTQEQKEAMKAGANPFDAAAVHRFSEMLTKFGSHAIAMAMMNGGGGDRAEKTATLSSSGGRTTSSASYTEGLAGGPTYKALVEQGYKPAHINSAMEFARHIGASEDMARKFIKMDQKSKENLHRFVDDMRSNPAKTPEEENAKIEEWRKKNPGAAKHLTPEDIRKIIRGDDKSKVQLKGEQEAGHDDTQGELVAEQRKLGVERAIDSQHAIASTKLRKNDKTAKDDLDILTAGIAKAEKQEGVKQPNNAKPPAEKKADQPDKPKPVERQAARPNVPAPKVG